MQRVMIIGGSGSGKSTFAIKLGEQTGLPVIHIDRIYWKPGWVERERDEVEKLIRQATSAESWIFEGNHSKSFEERLQRADTLIFLDVPTWLRFWRVISRTLRHYGKSRPDMGSQCPERFDLEFLKFVLDFEKRGSRKRMLSLLETAPSRVKVHHLKTNRQMKAILAGL